MQSGSYQKQGGILSFLLNHSGHCRSHNQANMPSTAMESDRLDVVAFRNKAITPRNEGRIHDHDDQRAFLDHAAYRDGFFAEKRDCSQPLALLNYQLSDVHFLDHIYFGHYDHDHRCKHHRRAEQDVF